MSFLEMIQTLHEKLPQLEKKIEDNGQEYNNSVNILSQAMTAIESNKEENNNLKIELDEKYNTINDKLPITATKDIEGIVTLSDMTTYTTDGDKVVTANMLHHVINNITAYIPTATQDQAGIVKLAKTDDTDTNNVVSLSTLDEIKQPVDISSFRYKGVTSQDLNYFIDVYDKTYKIITIFGILTIGDGAITSIELPVPLKTSTMGITITPLNSTAMTYPTALDSTHISLYADRTVGVSVQIIGCVDTDTVSTPVSADTTLTEDSIEISLNTEDTGE